MGPKHLLIGTICIYLVPYLNWSLSCTMQLAVGAQFKQSPRQVLLPQPAPHSSQDKHLRVKSRVTGFYTKSAPFSPAEVMNHADSSLDQSGDGNLSLSRVPPFLPLATGPYLHHQLNSLPTELKTSWECCFPPPLRRKEGRT